MLNLNCNIGYTMHKENLINRSYYLIRLIKTTIAELFPLIRKLSYV